MMLLLLCAFALEGKAVGDMTSLFYSTLSSNHRIHLGGFKL